MTNRNVSSYVLVGLLFFAAVGLLTGLYAGLVRLGFTANIIQSISPLAHGPLMIDGFLGTLISLERAAALEKKWAYLAPGSMALATVLLLAGIGGPGKIILLAGSVALLAIMIHLYILHPKPYHLIMIMGAASLLAGNILYSIDKPIYTLVSWWIGFPLLTIFGERLELNRIMRPPQKAIWLFITLIFIWILGIAGIHVNRNIGWQTACVMLIAMALWLFKYDVARRTIQATQWTRYSALCLLTGYGWLVLAGIFGIWKGLPRAGLSYDAQLHMIFVGFVFSMIFAHASVIIPSLSGKIIPYHKYFYAPLILLHLFLLIRIVGDLAYLPMVRKTGGYGNVLAILLFLGAVPYQLISNASPKKNKHKNRSQNPYVSDNQSSK